MVQCRDTDFETFRRRNGILTLQRGFDRESLCLVTITAVSESQSRNPRCSAKQTVAILKHRAKSIILVLTRGGTASGAALAMSALVALAAAFVLDVWVVKRVRDAANTLPATPA